MRRPGRPPIDDEDPSATVHLRLPSKQYDALYKQARQDRVSVPEAIRCALARDRREDQDDDEH